ncbi:hypothetical protein HBE96_07030 [Clostridium sp. P21]|uniref:Uncharacterized protein n=1 Tax=Clostridium muellerianum TaxID=2716538 RepID=A0A7Y0HNW7_9CLOT|nr:hypothetical protein [Clostridium muellerianum]NMM62446.1 hypothetical protein [Clostridium muellerianum]
MGENLKSDVINTAESFTRNFSNKGNFDYSVESLIKVEDLLDELSKFELGENNLYSVSSMVGSYILEVARRNYGGEYYWIQENEQPILVTGKPDFDVSIYAFQKVKDRLINGEEDNIMFYFKGYIEAVERGRKTGDCITIV